MVDEKDDKVKRLTDHIQEQLKEATKPFTFEPSTPKLASEIERVMHDVLGPIVERRRDAIKVTPVDPQPGDDPLMFRANISIEAWVVKDWPADRLRAIRIRDRDILDLYGITMEPWNDETASELVSILAAWEENLRGDSHEWTRRITPEMVDKALAPKEG